VKRRDFITLLGGATAWPALARAQQAERKRYIGVLIGRVDDTSTARIPAFVEALRQLGWSEDRNAHIEVRVTQGDAELARKYAAEFVAFPSDVILAVGGAHVGPSLQASRNVPIVFVIVPDPVGSGFVKSLARPGGNATGFSQFEYSLSAKWLELLREIAPGVKRAAILWDPALPAGIGQFAVIQSVAPTGMELNPINVRDAHEIEREITAFAQLGGGGMIATASALTLTHRNLIVALAAQHKMPAIFPERTYVDSGGLISYGAPFIDQFQRAAGYVDRILKGEKPGDLPVQNPTKYELVLNLKAAKVLGIEVPPMLLARADEVLE
jgi:putative tryptophan/tyrosine transport system substrate-binding protein